MIKKLLLILLCFLILNATITDVANLCYSSCGTCTSSPRNINGCTSCLSSFLTYQTISGPAACVPDNTVAAQQNI